MNRVLAFLDSSPSSSAVRRTANHFARLVGAEVDCLHVHDPGSNDAAPFDLDEDVRLLHGDPLEKMLEELRASDVIGAVLGARAIRGKPVGRITLALVTESPVPLLILPPGHSGLTKADPHVMIPLDGSEATTAALGPLATTLANAGAHLRLLHFFDSDRLPPFVGSEEDVRVLAEEFRLRHLTDQAETCDLRLGDPAQHMIDATIDRPTEAILIAWNQDLAPGRAEVVRRLLRESPLPIITLPSKAI
jgi:nucleotide-binding universal stress UspA family protein